MSKSVMIIDTPEDCCECPFGTMAFGKSICLLDQGNGIECPLKPYKDFIPIEWIEKWLDKTTGTRDGEDISQLPEQLKFAIGMINLMEMDWEKENEAN